LAAFNVRADYHDAPQLDCVHDREDSNGLGHADWRIRDFRTDSSFAPEAGVMPYVGFKRFAADSYQMPSPS
jgi:hypothetical protein